MEVLKEDGLTSNSPPNDEPPFCWTMGDEVAWSTTVQAEVSFAASLSFLRGQTDATQLHGLKVAG